MRPNFASEVWEILFKTNAGMYRVNSVDILTLNKTRINDIVGILAWKDNLTLDTINKIYHAKFESDLEEDLLSASDSQYHPVIQICMSGKIH